MATTKKLTLQLGDGRSVVIKEDSKVSIVGLFESWELTAIEHIVGQVKFLFMPRVGTQACVENVKSLSEVAVDRAEDVCSGDDH